MSQQDLCYHYSLKTRKLPPLHAYRTISQALASQKLLAPNTPLFNGLISQCAKNGELTLAADAWKMMRSRDVAPDSITYSALMNAYAEAGNTVKKALMQPLSQSKREQYLGRIMALYEDALARGLVSTPVFNVLLKGISWLGNLEHLSSVFPVPKATAEPLPVAPDVQSFVTAIYIVAYAGGTCWDGEQYFQAMKAYCLRPEEPVPTEAVLAMLVLFKRSVQNFPEARTRIFRKAREFMLPFGGMMRNSKVLDAYLGMCKSAGEYKHALQTFQRTINRYSMVEDESLQSTHLSLLIFNDQFAEAMAQFRLIKRPSRLAVNAMLEGCRRDGLVKECVELFNAFHEFHTLVPNIHSLEHAVKSVIGAKNKPFGSIGPEERVEALQKVLEIAWTREKKIFLQFGRFMPEVAEFCVKFGMQNEKLQEILVLIQQMQTDQ